MSFRKPRFTQRAQVMFDIGVTHKERIAALLRKRYFGTDRKRLFDRPGRIIDPS
jgi:hypothetical protein